jgi:hypothetical protein
MTAKQLEVYLFIMDCVLATYIAYIHTLASRYAYILKNTVILSFCLMPTRQPA